MINSMSIQNGDSLKIERKIVAGYIPGRIHSLELVKNSKS